METIFQQVARYGGMIAEGAAVIAAIFAYLGWVQMTNKSHRSVEETLYRKYEDLSLSDTNSNYVIKPTSFSVHESDSRWYQFQRTVLPYWPVQGETSILMSIEQGDIPERAIILVSEKHTQFDCRMTDVGMVALTIGETEPVRISKRFAEFSDLLSSVIGDAESTLSPDLDYMFDEE